MDIVRLWGSALHVATMRNTTQLSYNRAVFRVSPREITRFQHTCNSTPGNYLLRRQTNLGVFLAAWCQRRVFVCDKCGVFRTRSDARSYSIYTKQRKVLRLIPKGAVAIHTIILPTPFRHLMLAPYHCVPGKKSNWVAELRHPQNGNAAIMPIRQLVVCISHTTIIKNVRRKYIF